MTLTFAYSALASPKRTSAPMSVRSIPRQRHLATGGRTK
jgi:hypothetical protein